MSRSPFTALLLWSAALLLLGGPMARGQSALDGFDPNVNGWVNAVVVQPDGKILLGGFFSTLAPNGGTLVTRNSIARLNPDGTLDTAFDPNVSGVIFAIFVQPDGKILIGGDCTTVAPNGGGAVTRNDVARLNSDGTLDMAFDPNSNGLNAFVTSIALQTDGKILVGGQFGAIGGATRNHMARLDPVTGAADSFDPNAESQVYSIVVQPDGKILVGGAFNSIGGQARNRIVRLDPTSGLADSFNPNANGSVYTLAVQPDGKILVGGYFFNIGGQTRSRIARLDPATGLADSLNPNADSTVVSIVVQPDGKIVVGGWFTSIGGQTRNGFTRLDPITGTADSFNPNPNGLVYSIALQMDGRILVGGDFFTIGNQTRSRIARLEPDGRLDRTLDPGIAGVGVLATAVQPDGKILIAGGFTEVLGVPRNNIARLYPDGSLDLVFNPNANGDIRSVAVQPDGKVLRKWGCLFSRGAVGWQDTGGGSFRKHQRTNAQLHRPPRCHDWIG